MLLWGSASAIIPKYTGKPFGTILAVHDSRTAAYDRAQCQSSASCISISEDEAAATRLLTLQRNISVIIVILSVSIPRRCACVYLVAGRFGLSSRVLVTTVETVEECAGVRQHLRQRWRWYNCPALTFLSSSTKPALKKSESARTDPIQSDPTGGRFYGRGFFFLLHLSGSIH